MRVDLSSMAMEKHLLSGQMHKIDKCNFDTISISKTMDTMMMKVGVLECVEIHYI